MYVCEILFSLLNLPENTPKADVESVIQKKIRWSVHLRFFFL